jgi:hypothetical protein
VVEVTDHIGWGVCTGPDFKKTKTVSGSLLRLTSAWKNPPHFNENFFVHDIGLGLYQAKRRQIQGILAITSAKQPNRQQWQR